LSRPAAVCYTHVVGSLASRGIPKTSRRRSRIALEQLVLGLEAGAPRWTFSRRILASRHQARVVERLEFVRRFFPELEGVTIHVGQAIKRDVLGWGSMDPDRPGVWVRPRRLAYFTIAHEYTHLLQARGLVPGGERACDLHALTRSSLIVDSWPSYLKVPRALRMRRTVDRMWATRLHRLACDALARREGGDRRYLSHFERALAETWSAGGVMGTIRKAIAAVPLLLGFEP
jgi:hypothetical protein